MNNQQSDKLNYFTERLLSQLEKKMEVTDKTFGFEFEFLPLNIINMNMMEKLYKLLPELGFAANDGQFRASNGLFITFEPGGQIEYGSSPLYANDHELFNELLMQINETNSHIYKKFNIQYIPTSFLPDRGNAPLCLQSYRYKNLHRRMAFSGTKGREMMKGTASIHLHASFKTFEELLIIYKILFMLSKSEAFAMSSRRRDIWDNTDPSRCGMPSINLSQINDARELIKKIVHHALCAEYLYKDIPFYEVDDITFDDFCIHLTSIFTDVRLNMKGPTVELRTLDSLPVSIFADKWNLFISTVEQLS